MADLARLRLTTAGIDLDGPDERQAAVATAEIDWSPDARQNRAWAVHDNGDCDGPAQQETPRKSLADNAGLVCTRVQVAEEGLEVRLEFQGKTYLLAFAGDSRGTKRSKRMP